MTLDRREFLQTTALGGLAAAVGAAPLRAATPASQRPRVPPFELDEVTIDQLQDGLRRGAYTAKSLCERYLARIEAIDRRGPTLLWAVGAGQTGYRARLLLVGLDRLGIQSSRGMSPAARIAL